MDFTRPVAFVLIKADGTWETQVARVPYGMSGGPRNRLLGWWQKTFGGERRDVLTVQVFNPDLDKYPAEFFRDPLEQIPAENVYQFTRLQLVKMLLHFAQEGAAALGWTDPHARVRALIDSGQDYASEGEEEGATPEMRDALAALRGYNALTSLYRTAEYVKNLSPGKNLLGYDPSRAETRVRFLVTDLTTMLNRISACLVPGDLLSFDPTDGDLVAWWWQVHGKSEGLEEARTHVSVLPPKRSEEEDATINRTG